MKWVLLALFLAWPAVAADSSDTSIQLYQRCELADRGRTGARLSQNQAIAAGFCLGFLRGLLMGAAQRPDGVALTLCPPENITNAELEQIFLRYFRDVPDRRTEPDHVVAAAAFTGAFPCTAK